MSNAEWRSLERRSYCSAFDPEVSRALFTCQNFRSAPKDLFIFGDSHALHLVAGASDIFPDHNIYVPHLDGCVPQSGFANYVRDFATTAETEECIARNREMLSLLRDRRQASVIVASAKRDTPEGVAPAIGEILREISAAGHRVIYLADFVKPGRDLAQCGAVPAYLIGEEGLRTRCRGDADVAKSDLAYNAELSELVSPFVDIADIQCPKGRCLFTRNGKPLFRDDHHLSTVGSSYFLRQLRKAGRFAAIGAPPLDAAPQNPNTETTAD